MVWFSLTSAYRMPWVSVMKSSEPNNSQKWMKRPMCRCLQDSSRSSFRWSGCFYTLRQPWGSFIWIGQCSRASMSMKLPSSLSISSWYWSSWASSKNSFVVKSLQNWKAWSFRSLPSLAHSRPSTVASWIHRLPSISSSPSVPSYPACWFDLKNSVFAHFFYAKLWKRPWMKKSSLCLGHKRYPDWCEGYKRQRWSGLQEFKQGLREPALWWSDRCSIKRVVPRWSVPVEHFFIGGNKYETHVKWHQAKWSIDLG